MDFAGRIGCAQAIMMTGLVQPELSRIRMRGNVLDTILRNIDILGHLCVAGVPGRAEPDECELDFGFILKKADQMSYRGWFGLEYFPRLPFEESLRRQLALTGSAIKT